MLVVSGCLWGRGGGGGGEGGGGGGVGGQLPPHSQGTTIGDLHILLTVMFDPRSLIVFYIKRRQRSWAARSNSKQALLDVTSSPDQSNLLDQIFQFIGSKPEEAVSWKSSYCVEQAFKLVFTF